MITLPLTCRQIIIIVVGGFIILGMALILHTTEGDDNPLWIGGIVIVSVLGVLGLTIGMVELGIWLENHVKCKCDA